MKAKGIRRKSTHVSEKHVISIFRVEARSKKPTPSRQQATPNLPAACFVPFLACCLFHVGFLLGLLFKPEY
jgi:hypothetical protein